jgi:predicted HD phosphohydrolase
MREIEALTRENIVPFLADIFERRGGEAYLGEKVTMAEHMLQGAHFAEVRGEDAMVMVAALLHDIGHFTSEFGTFSMEDSQDRCHEEAGAVVLEPFFPAVVVDCVRHHVAAKRYLCATNPNYLGRLTPASIHSLKLQGGPMGADEAEAFAQNPNIDIILKVRHLDDEGKVAGLKSPPFAHFAPMVQHVVDAHCKSTTA